MYPEDKHEQFEAAKKATDTLLIFVNREGKPLHRVYSKVLESLENDIKILQRNVESRKPSE